MLRLCIENMHSSQDGLNITATVEDINQAFSKALEAKEEDGMLFCVGSLYLVGEIKDIIRRNKK